MNYFKNKESFETEFKERLKTRYLVSVKDSSDRERYNCLSDMVMEYLASDWIKTKKDYSKTEGKKVYYFSMEFLLGRQLENNIASLGLMNVVSDGFADLHIKLDDTLKYECDPGLGNGGLGRLAACYFDSLSSLKYHAVGNTIRFEYGLFRQRIKNGYQEERPDNWLHDSFKWEIRRDEESIEVPFYGSIEEVDGERIYKHAFKIKAVPYDIPVVGDKNGFINTLRCFKAEPAKRYPKDKSAFDYESDLRKICGFLYPDDSDDNGKRLRISQQYFLSCAGLHCALNDEIKAYGSLEHMEDHLIFHLNDTHPTLVIPELIRTLVYDYGYDFRKALDIAKKTCFYTNHTLLREAMEAWNIDLIKTTLPRIYEVIDKINQMMIDELREKGIDYDTLNAALIINNNTIYMANLCSYVCAKINGVAHLHSELLKSDALNQFYKIYPEKFDNVTNGISPRRWLKNSNKELSRFLDEYTPLWRNDFTKISGLKKDAKNIQAQETFMSIKNMRKEILCEYINTHCDNITLPLDSHFMFDVQIKRLHEYKRQLLNALYIIYTFNRLKSDEEFKANFTPTAFIFGAKAAGSYYFAKKVIKLINSLSSVIEKDNEINKLMRVVFIENYGVSLAEIINPAIDLSEQISLAGFEASGTGNMKAMMNGSVTIGTLDGANVEISEQVGEENMIIFGMKKDEVIERRSTYNSKYMYETNDFIKNTVDCLINGFFANDDKNEFIDIYNKLLYDDRFMVLADFESYINGKQKAMKLYKDKHLWAQMCINNVASSAFFSSDRSIEDYAKNIWNIKRN